MNMFLKRFLIIVGLLFSSLTYGQSIEFAKPPQMNIPKQEIIPGYIVKYTAKRKGTIYLSLLRDDELIGNAVYVVKRRGTNTISLALNVWGGVDKLTRLGNYRYDLAMWEDPENIFTNKVSEIPSVLGVTVGRQNKKRDQSKKTSKKGKIRRL